MDNWLRAEDNETTVAFSRHFNKTPAKYNDFQRKSLKKANNFTGKIFSSKSKKSKKISRILFLSILDKSSNSHHPTPRHFCQHPTKKLRQSKENSNCPYKKSNRQIWRLPVSSI